MAMQLAPATSSAPHRVLHAWYSQNCPLSPASHTHTAAPVGPSGRHAP